MKSSTLKRSSLSRQQMRVLEKLSAAERYRRAPNISVEEYVRPLKDKEQELDLLWQNFRINQKDVKSPGVYLATGFIAGAFIMLIMMTLLSFTVNNNNQAKNVVEVEKQPVQEKAKLTFIPADKKESKKLNTAVETSSEPETYTVQKGDTLAGIIVRIYGTYDVSKIEKIKKANNMHNANSLSIGQKLIIPME